MEKNTKMQTSLLEDSLANLGVSQALREEAKMTEISGTKWLGLLKTYGLDGSLAKMCQALLQCQWVSEEVSLTWKVSDTKPSHILFQLQPSTPSIDECDAGLWLSPSATNISTRSEEALKKRTEYRKSVGRTTVPPGNLAEQIQYGKPVKHMTTGNKQTSSTLWPTPTHQTAGTGPMMKTLVTKDGNPAKQGERAYNPKTGKHVQVTLNRAVNLWPTPTTMDTKEDALKHATKLLQGKTHRASGEPIQKSLVDKVMMEEIKKNPQLMKIYEDHEMIVRPNLPPQQEFVAYLREQTTIKELSEKTDIKKTTIEHWFRKDQKGFSHPSIEDWEKIKPHLNQIKYDQQMTEIQVKEWTTKKKESMWPTPTTKGYGHASMGQTMIFRKKVEAGEMTEQQAEQMLGCTLRPPRMEKWDYPKKEMFPTPTARDYKDSGSMENWKENRQRMSLPRKVYKGVMEQTSEENQSLGSLNPTWVEWLMGYPTGYTDLDV